MTGIKLYLIVYPYLEFTLSGGVSFKLELSSSPIGILLHFLNIILRLLWTFKGHILWKKKNYTHSPAETFTCSLLKKNLKSWNGCFSLPLNSLPHFVLFGIDSSLTLATYVSLLVPQLLCSFPGKCSISLALSHSLYSLYWISLSPYLWIAIWLQNNRSPANFLAKILFGAFGDLKSVFHWSAPWHPHNCFNELW